MTSIERAKRAAGKALMPLLVNYAPGHFHSWTDLADTAIDAAIASGEFIPKDRLQPIEIERGAYPEPRPYPTVTLYRLLDDQPPKTEKEQTDG